MKTILEKLSKEELIDFLIAYAQGNEEFANAVDVGFGKPEFSNELSKIENKIDYALDGVSDYRNHDRWGYIDFDVNGIVAEIIQRAEQGHIKLAFAELELLYRKLLENFEFQGECEISYEAENCLEIMSEIADKAVLSEDKEYIFQRCIELTALDDGKDYGADYEDRLLLIAAKFVTPNNRAELENALTLFESTWREEEFKLIRLEIIRCIEGEVTADIFIADNLQFPKIREVAFDKAIASEQYEESERLCVDALSTYEQRYGISDWLYKLYSVYEQADNVSRVTETARKIFLSGDMKYYDKVKSLLKEQSVWDDSYSKLIRECESNLSYSQYMEILAKESEYDLLLEQVKRYPEEIYYYGEMLVKKFRADVCEIFIEQIKREAEAAYGRESYRKVCSRILCFAKAGFHAEAIELKNSFSAKYKRKPAFVDELGKIAGF